MNTHFLKNLSRRFEVILKVSGPISLRARMSMYIIIGLLAVLQYSNTLDHGFVFDDYAVLAHNTFVQQGIAGTRELLTTGSWDGYDAEVGIRIYRPFQVLILAIQHEFFELEPKGYHVVQVLSFAVLCVILLHYLLRVFGNQKYGPLLAIGSTILFLIHPVHVEVVANIGGSGGF